MSGGVGDVARAWCRSETVRLRGTSVMAGDAAGLIGRRMPSDVLSSTTASDRPLVELTADPTVIFVYPKTGDPRSPDSEAWAAVPGAKGCTAEACSFRDLRRDFAALGWSIVGCSSQTTDYQAEAAARLHLPYPLLSDTEFVLADTLGLPTFEFEGTRLYRRMTLLARDGEIVGAIDPGSDATGHVEDVLRVVRAGVGDGDDGTPNPDAAL
ncbi:peroxiredoxin [Microbacterium sp. LjRoot45]|uniref:peroxiredoxin n=1 Tax=Microbacterium sp. LjRoot45 TaxID=3342329 RepID=UPI003ECF7BAF